MQKYKSLLPQADDNQRIDELYKDMETIIKTALSPLEYSLVMYGSAASGLMIKGGHSDLDIAITSQVEGEFFSQEIVEESMEKLIVELKNVKKANESQRYRVTALYN